MRWWLVGLWLASGLVIPVLWLLSAAGRRIVSGLSNAMRAKSAPVPSPNGVRTLPKRRRVGRFSLAGLVGVGALILLFVGSFSDPIVTLHDLVLPDAPAEVPASQAAVTPSTGEADQVPPVQPANGSVIEVALDAPSQADAATPQVAAEVSQVTPPVSSERPGVVSDPRQGHARGRPSARNSRPARAYFTRSVRGTWLFPPNPGGNG